MDMARVWPIVCQYSVGGILLALGIWSGISSGYLDLNQARDRRLLYAKAVTHGYWVRSVWPSRQVEEVVRRFNLADMVRLFSRCADCNGLIEPVAKAAVEDRLEPKTKKYHEKFYRCPACGKVYWEGSHVDRLRDRFKGVL